VHVPLSLRGAAYRAAPSPDRCPPLDVDASSPRARLPLIGATPSLDRRGRASGPGDPLSASALGSPGLSAALLEAGRPGPVETDPPDETDAGPARPSAPLGGPVQLLPPISE